MINDAVKKQLLTELEKTGSILHACKKVGISRATYYRWMEDENFCRQAAQAELVGRQNNVDIAEHMLMKNVTTGIQRAIEYYLRFNSARYRQPILQTLKEFENLSPDEGWAKLQVAKMLKQKFERIGSIPFKPYSHNDIKDTELEKYQQYIMDWYKEVFNPGEIKNRIKEEPQEKS